jgi:hypothetical protein
MNSMIKIGSAGEGGKGRLGSYIVLSIVIVCFFSIIIVVHKLIFVCFLLLINSYKIGLINRVDRLTFSAP